MLLGALRARRCASAIIWFCAAAAGARTGATLPPRPHTRGRHALSFQDEPLLPVGVSIMRVYYQGPSGAAPPQIGAPKIFDVVVCAIRITEVRMSKS